MTFGGGDATGRPGDEVDAARATRRQLGAWVLGVGLAVPAIAGAQILSSPLIDPRVLQSVAVDPRLRRFYALRNWTPAWTDDQARQFSQALEGAIRHGLDGDAFRPAPANDPASREAGLTLAALTYADALARGLVDPTKLFKLFTLERQVVDVAPGLSQALDRREIGAWLDRLAPRDAEYKALSAAYVALRAQIGRAGGSSIPEGGAIQPGGQDYRVPLIAQRLYDLGYLTGSPMASQTLSGPISEALKIIQAENGMQPTGRVGNTTIGVLNAGPTDHARQLVLNLERRRWLRREAPATRIDVNTAAAFLTYYRDGALDWSARTVVGSANRATPSLQSAFSQLVLNPPWNVPASIARAEILPRGAAYLRRQNMYVTNGRVVQRAGPNAALGLVKFDMQNPYAIYLHDTPSKALFARAARHRSHGCVRVENAVEFARHLADQYGAAERFEAVLASGDTGVVQLGTSIPVRLLYHTAFVGDQGKVVYRSDPYGWDITLATALGLDRPRSTLNPEEAAPDPETAPLGP
ncbi:L,D-transpeptidase family protein [Phenylobacterium sp.]|uniref:L,D-transpeptidase family protein n=1 Tax=Phenylobacterium sp. TaxID=1871053 RepID=UPI0030F47AD2